MQKCLSKLQEPLAKVAAYKERYKDKAPEILGDAPALGCCDITVDISRQRINKEELACLYKVAAEASVIQKHKDMLAGNVVNESEKRRALHSLLRDPLSKLPEAKEVQETLAAMRKFATQVRTGKWKGASGKKITDVINVGIGGSFAGPFLVWEACKDYHKKDLNLHWISNVDGWVLENLLAKLKPARTLVIVSSKSFGTAETILNTATILDWFEAHEIEGADLEKHFVVCSTNKQGGEKIGVPGAKVFPFWDFVGGRFSVWSSIGLPVMVAIGPAKFNELLKGAHQMDLNSVAAPEENIPLNLALLEIWNSIALGATSLCVLPYEQRLEHIIQWLQQLEMESLGKSLLLDGTLTQFPTSGVVWGGAGNDSQHAFFQCLRQGTGRTAIDIIYALNPSGFEVHHKFLLANANAQADALVTIDKDSKSANSVSVIKLSDITPFTVGALLAMYEHKTTMIGNLLGINPFDQPGVELGKRLARELMHKS